MPVMPETVRIPTPETGHSTVEPAESGAAGQTESVSPAARVLLYELQRAGASREFVRLYHDSLDELSPDDLRVLNHALASRPRPWLDVLSQAEFWGWRRWLAGLMGHGGK